MIKLGGVFLLFPRLAVTEAEQCHVTDQYKGADPTLPSTGPLLPSYAVARRIRGIWDRYYTKVDVWYNHCGGDYTKQ